MFINTSSILTPKITGNVLLSLLYLGIPQLRLRHIPFTTSEGYNEQFVLLGNCSHLPSQLTDSIKDLLSSLSRWLLYPIDISGKETFINAYGTGDFRDIQLRKSFEDISNRVVCIRLCRFKEAADMNILIDFIPADIVSIKPDFKLGTLLWSSFEKERESLKRTAVFIPMIGHDEYPFIAEP